MSGYGMGGKNLTIYSRLVFTHTAGDLSATAAQFHRYRRGQESEGPHSIDDRRSSLPHRPVLSPMP